MLHRVVWENFFQEPCEQKCGSDPYVYSWEEHSMPVLYDRTMFSVFKNSEEAVQLELGGQG